MKKKLSLSIQEINDRFKMSKDILFSVDLMKNNAISKFRKYRIQAVILASYLIEYQSYATGQNGMLDADGFFYLEEETVYDATALKPDEQRGSIKVLEKIGILEIKKKQGNMPIVKLNTTVLNKMMFPKENKGK